jgi:hypothetical protein
LSGLLTTERLKSFSDSVLLVAITILAYNLVPPSVVNGQANPDELEDFFYNLYGLISSFMVISVFWIFSMYFFDYLKDPDEIITLLTPINLLCFDTYNSHHYRCRTTKQDMAGSNGIVIITSCQFYDVDAVMVVSRKAQKSTK